MEQSDTPTYDQLSALCAQLVATLEAVNMAFGMAMVAQKIEPATSPAFMAGERALTAYRTLAPDPVYAEAMALKAVAEKVLGEWREGYGLRCIDELRATLNRARGEG